MRPWGPDRVHAQALSSHFALVFAMGVTASLALLHVWHWRPGSRAEPHLRVAAWCGASLLFLAARHVQLHTADPAVAVASARVQAAAAVLLLVTIAVFARDLGGRPWSARGRHAFLGLHVLVAALCVATPLFIPGATRLRTDWFGRTHIMVPGSWAMLALAPYALFTFAVVARHVLRAPSLEDGERRVLLASLGLYCGMGVLSVLSATRVVPFPVVMDFGPLVVAVGLSYMMVRRHHRLRSRLEVMLDARTREVAFADERRAASDERWRGLVENAPLGVVACDRVGGVVALNPCAAVLLGSPSAQTSGLFNVLRYPPLVEAGLADVFQRVMAAGTPDRVEVAYTSYWGQRRELRVHVVPLRDGAGRVSGAQAILEDVGDRRALEEGLRRSQKMEAVGTLAAGIAHEINNPMAYVRSNLTLLRRTWDEIAADVAKLEGEGPSGELARRAADCEELIDQSLDGVERTIAIVRDMREFAHGGVARERVDLHAVLESALRLAAPRIGPGVRIERDFSDSARVCGAPGSLGQVFLNLVLNAVQAVGPRGTVCVRTRAGDGNVLVDVEDDGPGICAEARERLFEPFFTTKPAGEGTGLGLYVSWQIVRIHGGEITVDSEPGRGTRFTVRLPREDEALVTTPSAGGTTSAG
jgi:PAS domain S-box-containing protein